MSGEMRFRVRLGRSLDPRYRYYPEWYLEITGEDGTETTISPRYQELCDIFEQIFAHEFLNDVMRGRTPDYTRKRLMFHLPVLLDNAQTRFGKYWKNPVEIPREYHIGNRPVYLDEIDSVEAAVHQVRRIEDLPVSVLEEMQAERGRC